MPEPITDAELMRYLAARDQARADQVADRLARLTERERALVREAAIMGWVHGAMTAAPNMAAVKAAIPPDSRIVATVVLECASHSDRYPVLGDDQPDEEDPYA
jgi:hypothetical protein